MSLPDQLPYFPRPDLLASILRLLLSGTNVTLFAPRRHGKTQFVRNELLPSLNEDGWFAARVDLWRNRDNPVLGLVEGLEAVAQASQPKRSILSTPLDLKSIRTTFKTPGVDIEGRWVPATGAVFAPQATMANRVADALHVIAERGSHALIALDEFQALAVPGAEDFVASLRTVLQDLEGSLSVIFTGSSRAGLNRLFQRAKAPLFRSAETVTLPNLGDDFVDSRADYLADIASLAVDRDQLKLLYPRLCYTPLFLNQLVRGMLVSGDTDVPRGFQRWLARKRDGEYADLIYCLSDLEFAVVVRLATGVDNSVYTAEARQAMGEFMAATRPPEVSKVQTAIRKLTNGGIVDPTGTKGSYEIADQGFQIVLREPQALGPASANTDSDEGDHEIV